MVDLLTAAYVPAILKIDSNVNSLRVLYSLSQIPQQYSIFLRRQRS